MKTREQLKQGIRDAILLADTGRRLEDQQQLKNALSIYTESIQKLLANYKQELNADDQQVITDCVNSILQWSDRIRAHIEWQETLDKEKNEFLDQEHLYTDYYETKEQIAKRISSPPPYESPPPYREAVNQQNNAASLLFIPAQEQELQPMNIYKNFQSEDNQPLRVRKEVSVRPNLLPPEFVRMPIRPLPPVSYTITRSFSSYGNILKNPQVERSQSAFSFLRRQSLRLGKTYEEVADMNRYMLSTGIRTAVVKLMGNEIADPFQMDLQLNYQTLQFSRKPEEGSSFDAKFSFTFCDYSQFLFRELRWRNNIDCDHYVHSLAADPDGNSLQEMISEGKSSANFFRSTNGEFVIKTLSENEFEFLTQILPSYMRHLFVNPNSLLSRFYGLHKVQAQNDEPIYFVVMENLIPTYPGITRYDLKGSKIGRMASEDEKHEGGVLKDLDFRVPFIIGSKFQKKFFKQLQADCGWLEKHTIMDYSLLVGVESRPELAFPAELAITKSPSLFKTENGAFRSVDENNRPLDTVYYVGIIDILQPYNMWKKMEHAFKSITESSTDISCVDPMKYSKRFQDFIKQNTASVIAMESI